VSRDDMAWVGHDPQKNESKNNKHSQRRGPVRRQYVTRKFEDKEEKKLFSALVLTPNGLIDELR
jgi:hypothetical protein